MEMDILKKIYNILGENFLNSKKKKKKNSGKVSYTTRELK